MTETLTLSAALLLGFAASGHCMVMCGGIASALGMATATNARGRPRLALLIAYQSGRVASYALAGAMIGGVLGGVVGLLDLEAVRIGLRALSALALLLAAGVAFGRIRDNGLGVGSRLWQRLAPLGRRLLPVITPWRALGFGMIWGWMPCGFVYSVLLIAALAADAWQSAATMIAFGVGTIPAMLVTSLGMPQALRFAGGLRARRAAGVVLLGCAAATLVVPLLPLHEAAREAAPGAAHSHGLSH
jgi:sulfite exporter TauE/SafE